MVKILKEFQSINKKNQSGSKPLLMIEEQILVTLEYWREYRTYFHIATSWGVSESTICRIVHRIESELMQSGMFRLPGKKALFQGGLSQPEVVVMDVTETPIERPKRKQQEFYSGKKKRIPSILRGKSYSRTHEQPKGLRTDFSRIIDPKEGIFPT
ncbi:transposase [Nodularia sp. NIES-3585]|nr:transposase [Nodularia sp. NIES-3585]